MADLEHLFDAVEVNLTKNALCADGPAGFRTHCPPPIEICTESQVRQASSDYASIQEHMLVGAHDGGREALCPWWAETLR